MGIDKVVDRTVQIKLRNFSNNLVGPVTGIYHPDDWFLAKVVGVDNLGMWLENPNYHRVKVKDATGNPIAKVDQVEEELTAYLLIRWEYIDSIVTFPSNTDNETLANVNRIGFKLSQDG